MTETKTESKAEITTEEAETPEPVQHVCPECGALFTNPKSMAAHRLAKHGVKPYYLHGRKKEQPSPLGEGFEAEETKEFRQSTRREEAAGKFYRAKRKKETEIIAYLRLHPEILHEIGAPLPGTTAPSYDPTIQDPIVRIRYAQMLDAMKETENAKIQPPPPVNNGVSREEVEQIVATAQLSTENKLLKQQNEQMKLQLTEEKEETKALRQAANKNLSTNNALVSMVSALDNRAEKLQENLGTAIQAFAGYMTNAPVVLENGKVRVAPPLRETPMSATQPGKPKARDVIVQTLKKIDPSLVVSR